jgi:phosphoribosylformylglycinamidine cyclo-ligase
MTGSAPKGLTYRDAGVDLDEGDRATERLKALVARTRDANTLSQVGSFGGLYALPRGVSQPVLVSSTDSVGTKVKVAIQADRHDTVGRCLVNHCVNDILVQGARPLFFLDYLGLGKLRAGLVVELVSGVAEACIENQCTLLGGESADLSDLYAPGEYDIAGFVVGLVERGLVIDGSRVRAGDALVAIASDGLHTNGYTLARRIVFDAMSLSIDDMLPDIGETVADALLRVHRSYLRPLSPFLADDALHALAHITGGGVPGNLPRVLPEGLGARVDRASWTPPPLFQVLARGGRVEQAEMDRVFNMGVGMIAVVAPDAAERIVSALQASGERAWVLGEVESGEGVRYA